MKTPEESLARFIHELEWDDVPTESREVVTAMVTTILGTSVAGAAEAGCSELRDWLVTRSGKAEATVLVHGDQLPAASAAQLNATMGRALDYCDAMIPGLHLGSALIPVALAAAEVRGAVSGKEFLAAIAAGTEIGARLNLTESQYDGFDPTGVVGPMASAATAAKMLRLTPEQIVNALGLAFNRIGGSFQSNVDGSLAVRLIQGWVAESGIVCAELAQAGLTGPAQFLRGVYGYTHLFGRGEVQAQDIVAALGGVWLLNRNAFKSYPSCGLTQAVTELALQAHADGVRLERTQKITVLLPQYAYRLVGHMFNPGKNPRVSAQFSAQYCAANALKNGSSLLNHFQPDVISAPNIVAAAQRIDVLPDSSMEERGHLAADIIVQGFDGSERLYTTDTIRTPTREDHEQRLLDCLSTSPYPMQEADQFELVSKLGRIQDLGDVRELIEAVTNFDLSSDAAITA